MPRHLEGLIWLLAPTLLTRPCNTIYIFFGAGSASKPTTVSGGSSGPGSRYNFANGDLVFCSTQAVILATSASTSSLVLPACKHTRIRSEPSGTVGGTIGLTTKFFS